MSQLQKARVVARIAYAQAMNAAYQLPDDRHEEMCKKVKLAASNYRKAFAELKLAFKSLN